jgi:hypothetical protein
MSTCEYLFLSAEEACANIRLITDDGAIWAFPEKCAPGGFDKSKWNDFVGVIELLRMKF